MTNYTSLAQTHANTFNTNAMRQIANYADDVADRYNDGMTKLEIERFAALRDAISNILTMQTDPDETDGVKPRGLTCAWGLPRS